MAQNNNTETLTRWLEDHQRLIYRVVMVYAREQPSQEDLFQDIALALWRSIPRFNGQCAETTWIYKVALNTAIDGARKRERNVDTTTLDPDRHWVSFEPPDPNLGWVYDRIRELNHVDRSLILMYLDGNHQAEIADVLGMSESSVGVRIHRIKQKLKSLSEAQS